MEIKSKEESGRQISMYGKTNTVLEIKINKVKKKKGTAYKTHETTEIMPAFA